MLTKEQEKDLIKRDIKRLLDEVKQGTLPVTLFKYEVDALVYKDYEKEVS